MLVALGGTVCVSLPRRKTFTVWPGEETLIGTAFERKDPAEITKYQAPVK